MDDVCPTAIEMPDVLTWLGRTTPEAARDLLVGCALDDGLTDAALLIVAFDSARKAVELDGGRRVLLAAVRDGLVLDERSGAPLAAAITASWSVGERAERRQRAELARAGFDAGRLASGHDRQAVLAVLHLVEAGTMPSTAQVHAFYLALSAGRDPGLARAGSHIFERIMERCSRDGGIPDDLHWRRVWCLRASGQLPEAVAASEALERGRVKDPTARKLLATTRAATLIDLFEVRHETKLLEQAQRAAKIAAALAPEDEPVKEVFRRLERVKSRNGR